MSLDWQKDEDEWQENVPANISTNTAVSQRRLRWAVWGITIILLALAGWFVHQQTNKRIAAAAAQTESQLLASHKLVIQAVGNQDRELLVMQLSGRDDGWTDAQILLGEERGFFNRPQFNLSWQPINAPITAEDIQIDIDPHLDSAEITYPLTYLPNDGGDAVMLQGTAVYRRGIQRWLLAPPEAAFWGEDREMQTANITLAYPERDEETAVRLAASLQNALDKMCQLPDLTCPPDLKLTIRLSTHPDSLLNLADLSTVPTGDTELPAPTLVGLPVDEAGYEALADGYAAQMVTAVLVNHTNYDCCERSLFYRALLDWQLDELGLKTWPMTSQSYEKVLVDGFQPLLLRTLWTNETDTTEDWQIVYALIEYLQTQIEEPPPVRALPTFRGRAFH